LGEIVEVPEYPHFESDRATAWFLEKLGAAANYLEYGSGGSTYAAAKIGVNFATVESDADFLDRVREKIRGDGLAKQFGQLYHHADIGPTGDWGFPLDHRNPSVDQLAKYRRYSDPPAELSRDGNSLPDLVLVDGRFRVACVLKVLRMLGDKTGWTIVIDDYVDRPYYHVVEEFAEVERYVEGRLVALTAKKVVHPQYLEGAILHYETVAW
jgi:hypothetical protein